MITEERQPEETDRWRFKMGDVGTMLGSITENQEGNSSVFFFLSVFIYWNSNGFSSLCDTSGCKIKSSWMCMPCSGERGGEVLQGMVGSHQPHSAPRAVRALQEVNAYCAHDQCHEGGREQNQRGQGLSC